MAVDFPPCLGHFVLDPSTLYRTEDECHVYYKFFGETAFEVLVHERGAVILNCMPELQVRSEVTGTDLPNATLKYYDLLIRGSGYDTLTQRLAHELSAVENLWAELPLIPMIKWSFYPGLVMFVVRFPSRMNFGGGEGVARRYAEWQVRHLETYQTLYAQYDKSVFPVFHNAVLMTEFLVPAAFLVPFCSAMAGRETFPVIPDIKMLVQGWLATTVDQTVFFQETRRDYPWRHEFEIRAVTFGESAALVN